MRAKSQERKKKIATKYMENIFIRHLRKLNVSSKETVSSFITRAKKI